MDQKYMTEYPPDDRPFHHWNSAAQQWDIDNSNSEPEAWWIDNPEVLPDSDPKHLCELCRRINLKLLVQDPRILTARCEEEFCHCIDMGSFTEMLTREHCALCSLISKASQPSNHCLTLTSSVKLCVHTPTSSSTFFKFRIQSSTTDSQEKKDYFIQEIGTQPGQGRIVPKKIDRFLPRHWVHICESTHLDSPTADWGSLGIDLDFIDTKDRCIATVLRPRRYAALSYVWGGNQALQLDSRTERILRSKDGLKKVSLPETIRDAVRITRNLGLRYLWVDSICIMQDDNRRRGRLLARMGWIYENATVTIVAASNKNARQGLAGVKSVLRNSSQITADIQDMTLATFINNPEDTLEDVKKSQWSTRGWTLQEGLLSRRLLYVTPRQVVFVCKHATFFEEINEPISLSGEVKKTGTYKALFDGSQGLLQDNGWRWDAYCQVVEEYSQRKFTNDEDVIPAMAGVLKRLNLDLPTKYLFNLPETEMDEALLWQPKVWLDRRTLDSTEYFPSWSWVGWKGDVTFQETSIHPPGGLWPLMSAIRWLLEDSGSTEEVEISSEDFRLKDWKIHGWKWGTSRYLWYQQRQYYYHDKFPGNFFLHPVPLIPTKKSKESLLRNTTGALCFMALAAKLKSFPICQDIKGESKQLSLTLHQDSDTEISHWVCVIDTTGYWIGSIKIMSPKRAYTGDLQLIALSRWNTDYWHSTRFNDDPTTYPAHFEEPIAADIMDGPSELPCDPSIDYYNHGSLFFDKKKYKHGFYCFYNVMAVEYVDGVAYRIGLGKVHVAGFHTAEPEWKRIELR